MGCWLVESERVKQHVILCHAIEHISRRSPLHRWAGELKLYGCGGRCPELRARERARAPAATNFIKYLMGQASLPFSRFTSIVTSCCVPTYITIQNATQRLSWGNDQHAFLQQGLSKVIFTHNGYLQPDSRGSNNLVLPGVHFQTWLTSSQWPSEPIYLFPTMSFRMQSTTRRLSNLFFNFFLCIEEISFHSAQNSSSPTNPPSSKDGSHRGIL